MQFVLRHLHYIVENEDELYLHLDGAVFAPELGTNPKYLNAIVEDLASRGMLEKQGAGGYNTYCHLTMKVFDFYKAGGYTFEDHIIEGNIMKLKMEIEAMEAKIGKPQYDKMMAMIMAVIGGFSLISGKNP